MNVLVLGGTVFFGRHLVAELVARGHRVTTFNRGTHNVDEALPVERLSGDRTDPGQLARIPAGGWDAVIDPSSDDPRAASAAADHLRGARRYVHISSITAYDLRHPPRTELTPVVADHGGDPHAGTAEAFGWRKATCESRVEAVFGARATAIRPGLIVGPYDPTDRFTYRPVRVARGGNVLVPAPPDAAIGFIDVRDLAAFVANVVQRDLAGVYNVTSPAGAISLRELIDACRSDGENIARDPLGRSRIAQRERLHGSAALAAAGVALPRPALRRCKPCARRRTALSFADPNRFRHPRVVHANGPRRIACRATF